MTVVRNVPWGAIAEALPRIADLIRSQDSAGGKTGFEKLEAVVRSVEPLVREVLPAERGALVSAVATIAVNAVRLYMMLK